MLPHIIDAFLFLYASWAFCRIGYLSRRVEALETLVDNEIAEVWEAFTKYIKGGESHADQPKA